MKPWRLVGLLAVTATASYLARVNVSVAGALMRDELALDPIQMGRVFSAFLLGYALCQVPAGMLADRFGAKRVLALAALSWVVATAALALVPSTAALPLLLGFRLLLGIGEAPTFPAAAQAISRHIPPAARGRANGLVIAAIGLGSAIAPPLVGFVMVRYGWRAALAVSGLPALAVAIAWLAVKEMLPELEPSHAGEGTPPGARFERKTELTPSGLRRGSGRGRSSSSRRATRCRDTSATSSSSGSTSTSSTCAASASSGGRSSAACRGSSPSSRSRSEERFPTRW